MIESNKYIWILHLSDFHSKDTYGENQNLRLRANEIAEDWKKNIRKNWNAPEKPDLCLITGDIAYSGKREQFVQATKIIKIFEKKLNLHRNQIYVVPGNHDQKRNAGIVGLGKNRLRTLIRYPNQEPIIEASYKTTENAKEVKLLKEHPYFILFSNDPSKFTNWYVNDNYWNNGVTPRFQYYDEWIRSTFMDINFSDRIADCWGKQVKINGHRVLLLGINSAIASTGYKNVCSFIWLSGEQINKAFMNENGNDIVIALMHHTWEDMLREEREDSSSGKLLCKNTHVILTGHNHRFNCRPQYIEGGQAIMLTARALGDPDGRDSHGYNILRIDINKYELTMFPRRWCYREEFDNDTDWIKSDDYPITRSLQKILRQERFFGDQASFLKKEIVKETTDAKLNIDKREKEEFINSKYDELLRCINDFIEKRNEDRMKLLRLINKYRKKEKDPQLKELLGKIRIGLITGEPNPSEQMKSLLKTVN